MNRIQSPLFIVLVGWTCVSIVYFAIQAYLVLNSVRTLEVPLEFSTKPINETYFYQKERKRRVVSNNTSLRHSGKKRW